MAGRARSGLVIAKTSFWRGRLFVRVGEVWEAGDPVVLSQPSAFGPFIPKSSEKPTPAVEQATAAPGERRGWRSAEKATA